MNEPSLLLLRNQESDKKDKSLSRLGSINSSSFKDTDSPSETEEHPLEEQNLDNDLPFLSDSWFDDDDEEHETSSTRIQSDTYEYNVQDNNNVEMDMITLGQPIFHTTSSSLLLDEEDTRQSLQRRIHVVHKWMGSMALCRGKNGDVLREAGAIHGSLSLLHHIIPHLHQDELVVDLATCILGALRDLACGSSLNRHAIGYFNNTSCHGMEIIASFVQRKYLVSWEDIMSSSCKELRLLTTACGVIRNTTHSNRMNSDTVQAMGLTQLLIWRLLHGNSSSSSQNQSPPTLPDASTPWREACFRIASALVNVAENNVECAIMCASDNALVELLLTTWDDHLLVDEDNDDDDSQVQMHKGRSVPLLHPGLANILAQWTIMKGNKDSKLGRVVEGIMAREEKRKIAARLREQQSSSLHIKVTKKDRE